ncbi:hypothetical protein NDU88_002293, partial [Pleurodeles waltl]
MQGSDSFTPKEIPSFFLCRLKSGCLLRMHSPGKCCKAGKSFVINVAEESSLWVAALSVPGGSVAVPKARSQSKGFRGILL